MKSIISRMVIVALCTAALSTSTNAQCKGMGGGGGGAAKCGAAAPAIAPETLQKFNSETKVFREKLIDKHALLQKEFLKDDPDIDVIATLKKDIIDLQTDICKIAKKLGMKNCAGACGMAMGCGGGMGGGGGMGCGGGGMMGHGGAMGCGGMGHGEEMGHGEGTGYGGGTPAPVKK